MIILTPETLNIMCGGSPNAENVNSFCAGLNEFGEATGLDQLHRLAQYLGQWMHESDRFRYDRELWGPTPAQKRYEGRKDLGNTQPGDGKKFSGHTAAQITGRYNTGKFSEWARALDPNSPDFLHNPKLMNTDPWEGLGPIWYWVTRNLNHKADSGFRRTITKTINGGYNGMADRHRCIDRASLVLLGYGPTDIKLFQQESGLKDDGVSGKNTRAKMHERLKNTPLPIDVPDVHDEIPAAHRPTIGLSQIIMALIEAIKTMFGAKK